MKETSVEWKDVESIISSYAKSAWVPLTKEAQGDYKDSKFSGKPVLQKNEEWPCCKNCGKNMQLFLQLNSETLPEEARKPFGEGILQVFYCTDFEQECEIQCEAFFPFSKSTLVRILHPEQDELVSSDSFLVEDAFPERVITGWENKVDYPNWEELEELGCNLVDSESEVLSESNYPLSKDKLLGWPYWVQGVEYPQCTECKKPMKLIFQIDSDDNVPYMFGDVGCAHITQCSEHKNVLTIAWACC